MARQGSRQTSSLRSGRWTVARRAVAAGLLVLSGLATTAGAEPGAATTHECEVTVGSPHAGDDLYAYYDGNNLPLVPHTFGACPLAVLEASAEALATDTPDGCRVVVRRPGTAEERVEPGAQLAPGDDLWGVCNVGALEARIALTITASDLDDPPTLHELDRIVAVEIPSAHDGTLLRGHVYLPKGPGPFATVLEYSPYWNTEYGPGESQDEVVNGRRTMRGWHRPFMDAGFAVALVNIRGTGESDGCLEWGSQVERVDAHTVIEALAEQPWSNGNIGMFGLSYPGWTQWMAVAQAPPSLKAIVPISAVIDYWSLISRGGARLITGTAAATQWQVGASGGAFAAYSAAGSDRFVPDTAPDHLACPDYAEDLDVHAQHATDGERTDYFEQLDLRPLVAGATVPALVANGLTFDDGSIHQFEGVWQLLDGPKRMVLGQWGHDLPARPDFAQLAVDWFDRYLRGNDPAPALATEVVEYQADDGTWFTTDQWPPPSRAEALHLSDGALTTDPGAVVASERSFQSSGAGWSRMCSAPDHVRYVSPPLAQEVHLAGNFTVELTLASNLPEGNLVAHVWAVGGEGGCGDQHRQVTRAMTTLRHARGAAGHGEDIPVGEPFEVRFTSLPFATTVAAGQHLVVTVSSDATELVPDPRRPRVTVMTSGGTVGAVQLPVVHGELRVAGS